MYIDKYVVYVFIYLGFNNVFNTVQVISQRVVLRAEETSTYSWCQGSVMSLHWITEHLDIQINRCFY